MSTPNPTSVCWPQPLRRSSLSRSNRKPRFRWADPKWAWTLVRAASLSIVLGSAVVSDAAGRVFEQPPTRHGNPPAAIDAPESVGLSSQVLDQIGPLALDAIESGNTAGLVVAIGRRRGLAYLRAWGNRSIEPDVLPMRPETIFDLASLTKPLATATSIMILVDRGQLDLDQPVSTFLPEFHHGPQADVTVRHLLLHTSGLIPDNALSDYRDGPRQAWTRILKQHPQTPPGERFKYSDVGYLLLGRIVEAVSGQPLDEFAQGNIFQPLGMTATGFNPPKTQWPRCAATHLRDGQMLMGQVHDPRAARLGGVAGHAGLFSNARDLASYCQMMLGDGTRRGSPILSAATVRLMTTPVRTTGGLRTPGWDADSVYSSNRAEGLSASAFGHGGFTGTVLWIDPERDLFYIVLANRLHPDGKGSINQTAAAIGQIACQAIVESDSSSAAPAEKSQPLSPDSSLDHSRPAAQRPVAPRPTPPVADVLTGLDVLAAQAFEPLRGRRIGLITNVTGISRRGETNVQLFQSCDQVTLVALFSPEHGMTARLDQAEIGDDLHRDGGVPIYSLYGPTRQPTEDQLHGIDTLVFDIQDVGTRYYTYPSTMYLAIEAAAKWNRSFVILDRPNPLGGTRVEGPMLDEDKTSFVGMHPIPIRHGLTIGELARLYVREKQLDVDLTVIPVENWSREMEFDQTQLPWIDPSPNLRHLNQAFLYPAVAMIEFTNVSVGRGTEMPFQFVGAPWIDGRSLATTCNSLHLPGIRFVPRTLTPQSGPYANERCSGVEWVLVDRNAFQPVLTGLCFAATLRSHYPEQWKHERTLKLLGHQQTYSRWIASSPRALTGMLEQWPLEQRENLEAWTRRTEPILLYPR